MDESVYTEAVQVRGNVPLYACVPQDSSSVVTVGRMEDLTLEAQRNRNRAMGIDPYVQSTKPGAEACYSEPRAEPIRRAPSAEKVDPYALPKPLMASDRATDAYALPKPLMSEGDYSEPTQDGPMRSPPAVEYEAPAPVPAKRASKEPQQPPVAPPRASIGAIAPDVYSMPTATLGPRSREPDPVPAALPKLPPRAYELAVLATQQARPDSVQLMGVGANASFLNNIFRRVVGILLADK